MTNPYHCIDYAIKNMKKGRILSATSMVKKQGVTVIALVKDYLSFRLTGATNIAVSVLKKNRTAKKPYGKDAMKRCRSVHAQYYTQDALCGEIPVRLFFVKCKGAQKTQVMITSNTELSFIEAFKTYAKRWTTEVMYKETKQLLRIQGCQSTSLAHQHAHIAMTLVLYSLLSSIKSSEHYYTLGGLFSEIKQNLYLDGFSAVFSIFDAISMFISSFSHCSFVT